ncbi:RelA/SpoT domain-containing protein [Clostridium saccharoperbutylacetonicum]|jgi:ppGpp synthetase/RelA/SpoT-type nucleotidyltranferase|uniref:RelA/SpoT domain-containing protein n=1 Tax=Clostridium saccharoperbutylacetonicum N1-4(HMT) TaxID=931276 RepID=M1MKG7_9CLOT|nr:RelA/SpoT domain-containing protein [Clostridium saccharoperbutylacetonicum]AGF55296.1 RelA/SpoT domain-containing protein [Clostridium saccharoperbutylacetonicum N1-4(HMT)]AQR94182.1 GTP pyrophosphokinase YwaC [Clostridium saccharoperbutylacetonicum]NRT63991.1 ppGpp synthetase/RelA/SpoT-type nucleotidyltransferase [Clostridium saccharoperbutylacetonicum]NSB27358.1 ppGpp synthetase/RelA/SpoT-type nucleotidyltransferase [Clostridium saccharoperbutylacetonicum]NSB29882.1 ppGpp synthetase/RelA
MDKKFSMHGFLSKYPRTEETILKHNINVDNLKEIYEDYMEYKNSYESQAEFIANILRSENMVHSVKSRIKDPDRLIEKIIRKTEDRKSKYGSDFEFTVENYKNEINDLIGIRVIHIFKDQWQGIHEFISKTWNVIEITANVRDGDNIEVFDDPSIEVRSKASGYRSVHYLVEFYPTNQKVIAEIQVRTIFEEGYGEIDHRLRYSHNEIPEILKSNLLLFNRIVGSADEMASLINNLSKEWGEKETNYKKIIEKQKAEIYKLKNNKIQN